MPDTPQNQATYPPRKAQKPVVGLPLARATAIVSQATACVMDLAIASYRGEETGESAWLRAMLGSRSRGDIAVMDQEEAIENADSSRRKCYLARRTSRDEKSAAMYLELITMDYIERIVLKLIPGEEAFNS